jgi:RHS repeat-associated protein
MTRKKDIEKIPSDDPPKSYVAEGIILNCTFGDSTVELQTPGRKSAKINDKLQANISDFKPMVNIPSFGKCSCRGNPVVASATSANHGSLTPMPCVPNTTMPWINGKEDVIVDGAPALLEISKNMCLWGGTISVGEKAKKGPDWGRIGEGTTKVVNGGLLCWLGVGALAAAGVGLAVLTAPVSVPTLVAAAAIGTLAAGGTGAAICLTTGASDIYEGSQDIKYGSTGSNQESRNLLKEAIGSEAYYNAEMIGTGLSLSAMATVPYLAPFAASAGVGEAGAEVAINRKLASQPSKKPVKTSAQNLKGNSNPVEEIETTNNRRLGQRVRLKSKNLNPFRRKAKLRDPVDAITGEVLLDRNDFTLPGRIPIKWDRHYGSQSDYCGICGRGWETPGDVRLEFAEDGTVLFNDGSGAPSYFPALPGNAPLVEPIEGRRLQKEEGYYTIHFQEGLTYYFPIPQAPVKRILIERITNQFGNSVQFLHDTNGIREIRENSGRSIKVNSKNGLIESMYLHIPGKSPSLLVRYTYDNYANLTAAYDALGVPYRFEYKDNLLIKHTNRNGLSFNYEYDQYTPNGRCTHTWGEGGLYEGWFVYHDDQKVVEAIGTLGTINFLYDENYRILQETNTLGAVTQYKYDEYGRTTAVIDPDGCRTEYVYDRSGNLLKLTRPDGVAIKSEYDSNGKPFQVTDPNGAIWKQEWDAKGQLQRQLSPLGAATQYQYDEHGQPVAYIDPLGNQTKLAFDNYGNLVSTTDAQGETIKFTYDLLGNLISRVDPRGRSVTYQYDAKGRLIQANLPGDATIVCEYDAEDNLIFYRDENGAITRLEYCGVNELKRRIQPDKQTVEYEYNAEEQLVAVINQRGERYELKRDAEGRIVEEVDYWGQSRKYSYSAAGHLRESVDPLGRTIGYQTDPLGRILAKVRPDPAGSEPAQSETFTYDNNGNLIACANRETEVKRDFDCEGKLLKEEQGSDLSITYNYDLNGNRVSRTTAIQTGDLTRTQTVNYSYDALGQAAAVEMEGRQPIKFNRDKLGRLASEVLSGKLRRLRQYDDAGNLALLVVTTGSGPLFRQEYFYDKAGNLTGKEDSVFGNDRFFYDPMSRITRQIDPLGQTQQYLYDKGGDRLTTAINAASSNNPDSKWKRTGELAGQTYRFDRVGNLVERDGAQGKTEFVWDVNGRLIESISGGQTTTYKYDPLGRRISKETGGKTTRFVWDGDALLGDLRLEKHGADDPVCTRVREWVYYPGSFEPLALVQADGLAGENERVYYYCNQVNGCPERLLDESGKVVWSALYDAWGKRITKLPHTVKDKGWLVKEVDQPLRLQGQYWDEETGLHYNRWRYYEPGIGAFVSQDPLGLAAGENVYGFGANAQGWIDPLGLCKKSSELKQHVRNEYQRLIDSGTSHKKIGPSLSIAQDNKTGTLSKIYGNDNLGRMPEKLSDSIAARLESAPEYIKTKGIGSHSEIYAVDELLKARPGAEFEDISVFTMEVQKASMRGTFKPACPHCAHLLEGVNFIK